MKFLDNLVVATEYELGVKSMFDRRYPGGHRMCKHLRINNEYSLSVQASEFHYCIPRALVPLDQYTHFEMAIIFEGQLTNNISILKEFDRYIELVECFDGGVLHNVPKDLIEDLYVWWLENA